MQTDPVVGKKLALIVDDEPDLREALAYELERAGFSVLEAESGNQAIEMISKNRFDVVVSDIRMPNGSGVDLLNWISLHRSGQLPIVLLSGFSDLSRDDAVKKGALALLSKPIDRDLMMATLIKAVGTS